MLMGSYPSYSRPRPICISLTVSIRGKRLRGPIKLHVRAVHAATELRRDRFKLPDPSQGHDLGKLPERPNSRYSEFGALLRDVICIRALFLVLSLIVTMET